MAKAKREKRKLVAHDVLRALEDGPFSKPAHVWLYEVRNATGWNRTERYADAIITSVYPSRGIWLAGIEVKVSRSDWKKELTDPLKSDAIQRYCDYWYVAAAEGIVELGEVPEKWGFYEVSAGDNPRRPAKLVKAAPKLETAPLDCRFVASVLRNQAEASEAIRRDGHDKGWQAARKHFGDGKLAELQSELHEATQQVMLAKSDSERAKQALAELRHVVEEFEREVGVTGLLMKRGWRAGANIAHAYKVAQGIAHYGGAESFATALERLAAELRAVPNGAAPAETAAE